MVRKVVSSWSGGSPLRTKASAPADMAGFESGDVILKFGDARIKGMRDLPRAVADAEIGSDVKVRVLRQEEKETLTVNIAKMDNEPLVVAEAEETQSEEFGAATEVMGLKLVTLTPELRQRSMYSK